MRVLNEKMIEKVLAAQGPVELITVKQPETLVVREVLVLILVFIFGVFCYRWFRSGRLDVYNMWEELTGKK